MAKRKSKTKRKKRVAAQQTSTARRGRPRGPNRSDESILADLQQQLVAMQKRVDMGRQFTPAKIKKERDRLELSAADYAVLVGVTPLTIYNWEHGRSKPRAKQLEAWLSIKGIGKRDAWTKLGY